MSLSILSFTAGYISEYFYSWVPRFALLSPPEKASRLERENTIAVPKLTRFHRGASAQLEPCEDRNLTLQWFHSF